MNDIKRTDVKLMDTIIKLTWSLTLIVILSSCSSEEPTIPTVNIGSSPSSNADARSSYTNSKTDIRIDFFALPSDVNSGNLRDAIAYLDANGDGFTDVFMGTGEYLYKGEKTCILALNDGYGNFNYSSDEFDGDMPPATHARKSIVSDFNNDGLQDIIVLDHGFDSHPFPGSNPKLIIQNSVGSFSWSILAGQTGFHQGGAAGDVDNDGDIDIFVGGFDPFFYINDGEANFQKMDDRFDKSIAKVFTAELIDVDEDGFLDLLAGAQENDGDETSIYWGSSTGSYTSDLRTIISNFANYGTVLDFDAEDVDDDGDRDLIINRTGGGNNNNYIGRRIELLLNSGSRSFTSATNQINDPGTDTDAWFPWIRVQDIDGDGDVDIFPDNIAIGFVYLNDGNGNFTKTQ